MTQTFLEQGLGMIAEFFGSEYKPEAIRMVSGSMLLEPDQALREAYKRCCVEFNSLPTLARVKDIVIQEGRKIREEQTANREREAARMKAEEMGVKGLPKGHNEFSRACCRIMNYAFSEGHDPVKLLKMAEDSSARFPHSDAFRAWVKKLTPADPERVRKAAGE